MGALNIVINDGNPVTTDLRYIRYLNNTRRKNEKKNVTTETGKFSEQNQRNFQNRNRRMSEQNQQKVRTDHNRIMTIGEREDDSERGKERYGNMKYKRERMCKKKKERVKEDH